jgi:hypothetical protein
MIASIRTTQPQQIVPVNKKWNPSGLWDLALDRDSVGGNVSVPNATYSTPAIINNERAISVTGTTSVDRYNIVDNLNNAQGGALDIGAGDWSMLIRFKYLGVGNPATCPLFSRWNTGAAPLTCSYIISFDGANALFFAVMAGSSIIVASKTSINWTIGRYYTVVATRSGATINIYRLTHDTKLWESASATNGALTTVNYVALNNPMLGSIKVSAGFNTYPSPSLIATFKYALTESQSKELANNPWQLFAPVPTTKYSPSNSGNALLMF